MEQQMEKRRSVLFFALCLKLRQRRSRAEKWKPSDQHCPMHPAAAEKKDCSKNKTARTRPGEGGASNHKRIFGLDCHRPIRIERTPPRALMLAREGQTRN